MSRIRAAISSGTAISRRGSSHSIATTAGNSAIRSSSTAERIENPLNQENATLRGIVPGEYVVNVYHYVANGIDPVPVTV